MEKVRLIVNRAVNVSTITLRDVQRLIDCPVWARIPSDYKVAVTALNRGIPFVTGAPKSELSRSVSSLASLLAQGTQDIDALTPLEQKRLGILNARKGPSPLK
jgi:pilus assembly protein CpaE